MSLEYTSKINPNRLGYSMLSKKLVYLASPYSNGDSFLNTMAHVAMYRDLLKEGTVNPVAPLLSGMMPAADDIPWERWIEVDTELLRRCDAVFAFDAAVNWYKCRESKGRDIEVALAIDIGIPVFRIVAELYDWAKS